jgi:hypothetical protein
MEQAEHNGKSSLGAGHRSFVTASSVVLLILLVPVCAGTAAAAQQAAGLPDAPSAVLLSYASHDSQPDSVFSPDLDHGQNPAQTAATAQTPPAEPASRHTRLPLCAPMRPDISPEATASLQARDKALRPCREENPLQSVVSSPYVKPLTADQKFRLAVHNFKDPFNLLILTAGSGIFIASNAHNPYGPGLEGWGKIEGYSLVQDAQGEFFGTFFIPALTHEDPRYHRMGHGSISRRVLHAALHTYVSQHDDGRLMPNYAVLGNYVIGSELANLWVPGTPVNAPSTVKRIGLSIATDPAGTMIEEFLPDIARHIHVHNGLIQQIVNRIVTGNPNTPP